MTAATPSLFSLSTLAALFSRQRTSVFLTFLLVYSLAIIYYRRHSYRDPTSLFFDPTRGYDKIYSISREQQADAFIAAANTLPSKALSTNPPTLCLGVATVSRPSRQYIATTVGSLLAGLKTTERDALHFIFFIAHTNQSVHPVHGEKWTETLPDTLLGYEDVEDEAKLAEIATWEKTGNHRAKGLFDYAYLLQACQKTGAPYVAMLEGDVLAVEGWFPRAVEAAQYVDAQTYSSSPGVNGTTSTSTAINAATTLATSLADAPSTTPLPPWLYIRLFHTETYLGWNSEFWPTYLLASLLAALGLNAALIALRLTSPRLRPLLSNPTLLLLTLLPLPLAIALYFASGRMTQLPPAPGVRLMADYGCCSQGMLFPRAHVPLLLRSIARPPFAYMDMLLEAVAQANQLQKWAVFPSLLQHIGGQSSKADPVADQRARMIWNFAFELYDAGALGVAAML